MRNVSVFVRFPLIAALAAGCVVTATGPREASAQAAAPDKKTRDGARKAYGDGEKAYEAGKHAEAYENFKKANDLIPSPHAEYWMAMSLDKQGKEKEAGEAFEKFLANPGKDKAGAERVKEAQDRVKELQGKQTGEMNIITEPAGATVMVNGQPQMGEAPMIVKLPPGKHMVAISSPGYLTVEREIEVTAGEKGELNVALELSETSPEPAAAPLAPVSEPPSDPAPSGPKSKVPAYVTLGIAGAGALVGTFFGVKALSAKSDFNDNPTSDGADDVERNALISDMAFGVAITLGVTGIVLLTSSDSGGEKAKKERFMTASRPKLRVAPVIAPTMGGAAAQLTF